MGHRAALNKAESRAFCFPEPCRPPPSSFWTRLPWPAGVGGWASVARLSSMLKPHDSQAW